MSQSFEPHVSQGGKGIIRNLSNYSERHCRDEVNLNNKSIESAKIKIGDMRQYRSNEIKKIAELWKNIVKPNVTPQDAAMTQHSASMNLIDNNSEEKLYGFAIRKTKIPPKTMQRIQISQMIEPVYSKSEIWLAIPSNEIPENLLCEEQTIS